MAIRRNDEDENKESSDVGEKDEEGDDRDEKANLNDGRSIEVLVRRINTKFAMTRCGRFH